MDSTLGYIEREIVSGICSEGLVTASLFCIPLNATPLGENDHNHAHEHLPSLHESALQNKNLEWAAVMLSSME